MKKFLLYLAVAAGIFTVSCNKERFPYEKAPQPTGSQYFFPVGTETKYKIAEETTGFDFKVQRVVKDAAKSIKIEVTDTSKTVFPEGKGSLTANFTAGEEATTITLPIDYSKYKYGDLFGLDFKITEETTPYAPSSLHFEIELPEPWVSLGKALYRDGFVAGYYSSVQPMEYEVELLENQLTPGYYRLVNPYGAAFPYNDEGDYDVDKDYYLEIHAEDPDGAWIPVHLSNMHWSDGYFIMGSYAGYYIERNGATVEAQKAAGNTGTLKDGVITFPTGKLLVGEVNYNNGALYNANGSGMFRVVFPGVVLSDFSFSVAYAGMFVDPENNAVPRITFTKEGADVEVVKYMITDQKTSEETTLAAIVAGEAEGIESLKFEAEEEISIDPELEPGLYRIVAVAYDASNAEQPYKVDDAVTCDFYFPGMNMEPKEVEAEILLVDVDKVFPAAILEKYGLTTYNSIGYWIGGVDIKSGKSLLASTAQINSIVASGAATLEDLVAQYGSDFDDEDLAYINSEDGLASAFTSLSAETNYTWAVFLENAYGASKLLTATYTTAAIPYEGDVVLGNYVIGEDGTFTLAATDEENHFLVQNLILDNYTEFNAIYDPDALTLTLDGTEYGYEEQYGNNFGGLYGYADAQKTTAYGYFVGENYEGPLVFAVDATTKQICTLNTALLLPVINLSTEQVVGILGNYPAGSAVTLLPEEGTDSVKPQSGAPLKFHAIPGKKLDAKGTKFNHKLSLSHEDGWGTPCRKVGFGAFERIPSGFAYR